MAKSVSHAGRKYKLLSEQYFDELIRKSKLRDSPQLTKTLKLDKDIEKIKADACLDPYAKIKVLGQLTKEFIEERGKTREITGKDETIRLKGNPDAGVMVKTDRVLLDAPPHSQSRGVPTSHSEEEEAETPTSPTNTTLDEEFFDAPPVTQPFSKQGIVDLFETNKPSKVAQVRNILHSIEKSDLLSWNPSNGSLIIRGSQQPQAYITSLLASLVTSGLSGEAMTAAKNPGIGEVAIALANDPQYDLNQLSNVVLRNAVSKLRGSSTATRTRKTMPEAASVLHNLTTKGKGRKRKISDRTDVIGDCKKWKRLLM